MRWTPLRKLTTAGAVSLLVHLFGVIPFGIARLLIDHTREIEIAYLPDPEGTAKDEAAEAPDPLQRPEPRPEQDPPEEQPEDPAKKLDKKDEKRPEPLVVIPNAHLKMVDQEQFPDEADNAAANYLAQKNHRAEKETRATETNLVRSQAGEEASSESKNQKGEAGDPDHKIAELMDRPGDKSHLPRDNMPTADPKSEPPKDPQQSVLAMRDVVPRALEPTKEARRDGLEAPEQGVGPLPVARSGESEEPPSRSPQAGQTRLSLSHDDYERVVGHDVAAAERRQALSQRSHAPGRWDRVQQKLAMMRSSLENFTPTVRPGNQSELGTRKHPFAAYLATVHRQIHKFWGFGFLIDLDAKPASSPYNDMSLWTGLEITLSPGGTVERLIIEHPSGNGPFDAAAMDAVMSAGPFPAPPDVIKSRDGNVYISWRFHRDSRQCATDFAEPHILTIPPKDGPKGTPLTPLRPVRPPAEAARPLLASGGGREGAERGAQEREGGKASRDDQRPTQRATQAAAQSDVPVEAREVAQKWLAAYVKGDVRWLAGFSAVPFSAGGRAVADDAEGLRAMYRQMLDERQDRRGTLSFYTPAQVRRRLGHLPHGGDEEDMMFAELKSGTDDIVLLLQMADKGWRVVGIDR